MSARLKYCLIVFPSLTLLFSSGCVMKRTVTEGGSVVSESYYVKKPFGDAPKNQEE